MALKPCRECGKEVSSAAETCPYCGIPRPVKRRDQTPWIILGVIALVGIIQVVTQDKPAREPSEGLTPQPTEAPSTDTDPTPGITRVGQERAAQAWANLSNTPGVQRWTCDGDLCVIMYDPALWLQMEYDLKRDFTAGMGIALAYGQGARFTEIRNMMTNARLARYSTRFDSVEID